MSDDHAMPEPSTPLLELYGYVNSRGASCGRRTDGDLCKQGDTARLVHDRALWSASASVVMEEMKLLYAIAFPMILTGLLMYGKSAISMFFMGRIGKDALAGGSLAIGLANITGFSVLAGLAMGMEPISSQACGAKQWPLMGQTLHRTITILALACLPISIIWLYAEPILLFFGQDPTTSSIASTYLAYSLPDVFLQSLVHPLKIYLRTQNITLPFMLGSAFGLLVHAPVNYALVYKLKLGIRGIAIAVSLSDLTLLAIVLIYVQFSNTCAKSLQGWSVRHCFREWTQILCLAIPSCVSVCLEWWWYELMIFLSGYVSPESVATMGILLQATALVYIFPSSLSQAVSTRVGNELGAQMPYNARFSSFTALGCSVITSLLALMFMTTSRHRWGRIFTDDEAILTLTAAALPIVGLCELGNCPQTTGCGALRGSARPTLGAGLNLGSFYIVGLPVAGFLGFGVHKGLLGLWLGLLAAQIMCATAMIVVLARTDWEKEVHRAQELTGTDPESGQPKC